MTFKNPRRSTLTGYDFWGAADIAVRAGVWEEIGSYTIPNGVGLELGYGNLPGQAGAEGRIYGLFIDDTSGDVTEEPGLVRFGLYRPDDTPAVGSLFEERTEALKTSATDRTQQMPLPACGHIAGQDWKLKLFFKSDAADNLQHDFSKLQVSVTVYTDE